MGLARREADERPFGLDTLLFDVYRLYDEEQGSFDRDRTAAVLADHGVVLGPDEDPTEAAFAALGPYAERTARDRAARAAPFVAGSGPLPDDIAPAEVDLTPTLAVVTGDGIEYLLDQDVEEAGYQELLFDAVGLYRYSFGVAAVVAEAALVGWLGVPHRWDYGCRVVGPAPVGLDLGVFETLLSRQLADPLRSWTGLGRLDDDDLAALVARATSTR